MQKGTEEKGEEEGTGGFAKLTACSSHCSGPLVVGYYFFNYYYFYVCNGQSQVIKE